MGQLAPAHALKAQQGPPLLQITTNVSPTPPGAGLLPNRLSLRGGATLSTKAAGQETTDHPARNPQTMITPSLLIWAGSVHHLIPTADSSPCNGVSIPYSHLPPPPGEQGKRDNESPSLACKPQGLSFFSIISSFVDTANASPLSRGRKYFINVARTNDHFHLDLEPAYL